MKFPLSQFLAIATAATESQTLWVQVEYVEMLKPLSIALFLLVCFVDMLVKLLMYLLRVRNQAAGSHSALR